MLQKTLKFSEEISILIKHLEKLLRNVLNLKKAIKTKDPKDILKYKNQNNYVVKFNNQPKQEHFDDLSPLLD